MPKSIPFPAGYLNQTYATIRDAFQSGKQLANDEGALGDINITSTLSAIIQDTGRFVESFASDAIYPINRLRTLCTKQYPLEKEIDEIYVFGLKHNGVDFADSVMSSLNNDVNPYQPYLFVRRYYRKVLACRVHVWDNGGTWPDVTCELRDITNSIHRNNPADIGEDGKLLPFPFENGNPVPLPLYPKKEEDTI